MRALVLGSLMVAIPAVSAPAAPDVAVRLVRSLAAAIPTATLHRIEGAGHAAPFDAPQSFFRVIADSIG